jgi:hypothetical protein
MTIQLFSELRACGFGAVRTTRAHTGFSKDLTEIKDRFAAKLPWNTLFAMVVKDTLCLAWQDNNIVLALSTIHIVDKVKDFREKLKRRPTKTSTNGYIVRHIFGEDYVKSLQFVKELYYKLLSYSSRVKLYNLRVRLSGKRVFNPDL